MENLIKQFNNIETSFKRMKFVTTLCMAAAVVIAVGSVMISGKLMQEGNDKIYVVDKGSAVMAARTDEDLYRDLEAKDHVSRFHELMFNISPSSESIKRNLDKALVMSDKSAYDYYGPLRKRFLPKNDIC